MKLTKGEYCQFSLQSRLKLLHQFGSLVCEKHLNNISVQVFRIYDFFVEVFSDNTTRTVIRAEPVLSKGMMNFYQSKKTQDYLR
jgi:hypothetical protein